MHIAAESHGDIGVTENRLAQGVRLYHTFPERFFDMCVQSLYNVPKAWVRVRFAAPGFLVFMKCVVK